MSSVEPSWFADAPPSLINVMRAPSLDARSCGQPSSIEQSMIAQNLPANACRELQILINMDERRRITRPGRADGQTSEEISLFPGKIQVNPGRHVGHCRAQSSGRSSMRPFLSSRDSYHPFHAPCPRKSRKMAGDRPARRRDRACNRRGSVQSTPPAAPTEYRRTGFALVLVICAQQVSHPFC